MIYEDVSIVKELKVASTKLARDVTTMKAFINLLARDKVTPNATKYLGEFRFYTIFLPPVHGNWPRHPPEVASKPCL